MHMYKSDHHFFVCAYGLSIAYLQPFVPLLNCCSKELYIIAKGEYLMKRNPQNTFFGFALPWTLMF